ncbi:MAG TPA: tetratricopeptide repeat protein, partial [Phaeodactylibacter sp.]|nr:tetratricopeptide repeat protein [Phaeodactylibacter sp.]
GECHQHLGNYEKAKVYLYRALAKDPRDAVIYFHIGQCYAKEGIWESSLHFFKQAVKLHPQHDVYSAALANNYLQLGAADKALPLYRQAIKALPEIGEYWVALCRIYIEKTEVDTAMTILERAFENAYDAKLLYGQAACQFIKGEKKAAMDTLRDALLEGFEERKLLFDICPELKTDNDVSAIIAYYGVELGFEVSK